MIIESRSESTPIGLSGSFYYTTKPVHTDMQTYILPKMHSRAKLVAVNRNGKCQHTRLRHCEYSPSNNLM